MQVMVEERPELLEIVNTSTGHTPLATAVKKGFFLLETYS